MSSVRILLEFEEPQPEAFAAFAVATESSAEAIDATESLLDRVATHGVEMEDEQAPVPMFSTLQEPEPMMALATFAESKPSPDLGSATSVVSARVPADSLEALEREPGVHVWPNSELALLSPGASEAVDCAPFEPGVGVDRIQELLGVEEIWARGHTGDGIAVGIVDEGVNGDVYPVRGGYVGAGVPAPGTADITSHGSMCAADVLIAAPDAVIYDYRFLGQPRSGGALQMFQSVLDQRRIDGTPHLTNNSYGFYSVPPQAEAPTHEIWDRNHPLHRKVREVIASGAPAFFAAGNCGQDCPAGRCEPSSIGPGKSIHGANSLAEVITVAAVNSSGTRIGYSSQGPGMFEHEKPDFAAYSHMFGNFGPNRPGGLAQPFDNGTSAATPVASGVAALLLSARPDLTPAALKSALLAGAAGSGGQWNADLGSGVLNAAAALAAISGPSEGGRSATIV